MKKFFTFLYLLLLSFTASGQNCAVNIPVMSPETASLGRFGAYPVSYYTGTPDISIPLYRLNLHNLEIPISLQYDASGFMPNKDSGKVGHDWSLVAGGAIVRSVNLVPDEIQEDFSDASGYKSHGHWYAIKGLNRKLDEDSVRSLKYITTSAAGGINFETTPDMFSFNFGKHRGQFIIAHDGTPRVIGDGNYRVDLTGFAFQRMHGFTADSSISITTDDGTKYTFGGSPESLELSLWMQLENGNLTESTQNGIINAFYLTRIETTDGEKVDFAYRTYVSQADKYVDEDNIVKSRYYADGSNSAYGYSNTVWANDGVATEPRCSFTKVAYLSSIRSSAGTVTFNYAPKEHPFCSGDRFWKKNTLRLDHILVAANSGKTVKGIQLCHSYSVSRDNVSYRMFLTDVLCGKERYSLAYTAQDNLPRPETRGIDLRGYYNGQDNNSTLLSLHYGNSPDDVDFSHRQPDFASASKAMLKRITYPTGGYTEFTFENHRYGTRIHRIFGFRYPINDERPGMAGGLRIREIRNVPGETRTFDYETPFSEKGDPISSGVFSDLKTYAVLAHFSHIGFGITTWFISQANNVVHANSFSEPDIVYSRVTEQCGTGNGRKVRDYSTYLDCPDLPVLGSDAYSYYNKDAVTDDQRKLLQYVLAYTSQGIKRGRLQCLGEYSEGSASPQRQTTYTYSVKGNPDSQAVYAAEVRLLILSQYGICNSQAFYYYPYRLTREVVEEYSGGRCLTRQTDYTYSDRNKLLQEVRTTNSDGTVHRREYSYPADNTGEAACAAMVGKFMVSPVIYEREYAGSTLLKTLHNRYALFQNKFYALGSVEKSYGNGPFHTLVTFHDYDKRQNLLSFTEIGKPTEVYLWGYRYRYPIARLVNVSLDSVRSVVSPLILDVMANAPAPSDLDSILLGGLSSAFPSAQITAYRYRPLVGLTWTKNPCSLQHSYGYDSWGRLKEAFVDGRKVQEMAYNHTYTFPAVLSASFGDGTSSYEQGTRRFSMDVSGGSGVYGYSWSLMDSGGIRKASSASPSLDYTFSRSGSYTLTCAVTDLVTQERVEKTRSFTVSPYLITFSNISYSTNPGTGDASTWAEIDCRVPTTIEFRLEYRVGAATPTTRFECRVGNHLESGSGRGEKTFTLTLPAGQTNVSLDLFNIYAESLADLYIVSVSADDCRVGYPDCLNVTF